MGVARGVGGQVREGGLAALGDGQRCDHAGELAELGGELWGAYKPDYERYLAVEAPAGEEAR